MQNHIVRIQRPALESFCQAIFEKLGVSPDDAATSAAVLVAADARGIPSHGVARLQLYVNGIETRLMMPDASLEVLMDTPSSLVLHAHGGMGAPTSARASPSFSAKGAGDRGAGGECRARRSPGHSG